MALMSVIVPRMLLVCVHVTRHVLVVRRRFSDSGVRWGFVLESVGYHHFICRPRVEAKKTQEAILASWSTTEQIISAVGPWALM